MIWRECAVDALIVVAVLVGVSTAWDIFLAIRAKMRLRKLVARIKMERG